jgi:anti-sigma factor ChrR (cupin superfamily)
VTINGNLRKRAHADTASMPWTASPSGTVWRKRVHLVGPVEAGQVTAVVRYEPGSSFHAHDHPDGEEILVLAGVFSDEHGDWPAGTFLLNPAGFRHAPFSRDGCVLFVKLRQAPGEDRSHVVVQTHDMPWTPTTRPGVEAKRLYAQTGFSDEVHLERWAPAAEPPAASYPGGAEIFVLDGDFADEAGDYRAGTWLRLPAGAMHAPKTRHGCTLYVKRGGLAYLTDAGPDGPQADPPAQRRR